MLKKIFIGFWIIVMQILSFLAILSELTNELSGKLVIGIVLIFILNFCFLELYRLVTEGY